jgi:hypothetical protein
MRFFGYCLLYLIAPAMLVVAPAVGQEQKVAQQPVVAAAAPVQLVGLLTKQYRGRCGADGQHKWDDEHWEIGFVRLEVPKDLDLSKFEGKAVVVTGQPAMKKESPAPEYVHAAMELNPKPEGPGIECPQYQMRSDWVLGKNGMRIMRGRGTGLPPQLAVTEAKLFDGIKAELKGEQLSIVLSNDFKTPLQGLEVKIHYEGCYGKPGSDSRSEKVAELAAGSSKSFAFPTIVDEDQGKWGIRHHRAYSIQVLSSPGAILFDHDLSVGSYGVTTIECPEEK